MVDVTTLINIWFWASADGQPVDLAQHSHSLVSKAGVLVVCAQVLHRLQDIRLAGGTSSGSEVSPSHAVYWPRSSSVKHHSQVLGPRAVAVGSRKDVVPYWLEILPVGVGQSPLHPVDWG